MQGWRRRGGCAAWRRGARGQPHFVLPQDYMGPPGGGTFWFQIFIQVSSPEIWSETISGGEEVLAGKWGGLFWATSLEKIFGGVAAIISFRPGGSMQQSTVPRCAILSVGKHGRHRAVRRREFITLLGGAAVAWPLAARAQQERMRRIGFLRAAPPSERELEALLRGLSHHGWVQGRNFVLLPQWGDGNVARLPELAVALMNTNVDVILADGVVTARGPRAVT